MLRAVLAVAVAVCGSAVAVVAPASGQPADCPPVCDRIPDSAWIDTTAVPLDAVYHWPGLAGIAVTAPSPRFRFEDECVTPPVFADPRAYAVAARAAVPQPDGQWQLQTQVVHWRGETWRGGQDALSVLRTASANLRACQLTAPAASPSVTTDEPERLAAVVSIDGLRVLHQYLVAHPRSSSVVELALWSAAPHLTDWPPVPDVQVFDAMIAPLCTAYIGSCP